MKIEAPRVVINPLLRYFARMVRRDALPAQSSVPRDRGIGLIVLAAGAAAGLLARHAGGTSLLSAWVEVLLQVPVLVAWCRGPCGWGRRPRARGAASRPVRTGDAPEDSAPAAEPATTCEEAGRTTRTANRALTLLVMAGGAVLAITLARIEVFFAALTTTIAGLLAIDALSRLYRRVERHVSAPSGMLRTLAGPWLLLILLATVLLSLPLAAHPAVPDYRHNFWDHVLNNAFAAVSSACLVGTTVYSFGEEYALFGRIVLAATVQLAGMGFAALGLAIARPFLSRVVRLRTVLLSAMGLQVLAVGVMWASWRGSDAASLWDRFWWGTVHAGSALWNAGLTLRNDGLASYMSDAAVFATVTTLSVIGSLGLPVLLALVLGDRARSCDPERPRAFARPAVRPSRSRTVGHDSKGAPPPPLATGRAQPGRAVPWRGLPSWEVAGAFALLLTGACLLFLCETPWAGGIIWSLPDSWVPSPPVVPETAAPPDGTRAAVGSNRVPLRDDMSYAARWRLAVFVSATLRSAGIQSIPVSQGAVSWPSYGLLLLWMFVGGSAGGVAGGMRTSAFLLMGICVVHRRAAWTSRSGAPAARRTILRASLLLVPLWLAMNGASAALLAAGSDGPWYEVVLESTAACNGVALSTGLSLHLTWVGRIAMIVIMVSGRIVPVAYWLAVSGRLTLCLRAREDERPNTA